MEREAKIFHTELHPVEVYPFTLAELIYLYNLQIFQASIPDIHVVCGCLKDFLRGLKEPLITFGLWKDFVKAARKLRQMGTTLKTHFKFALVAVSHRPQRIINISLT